MHRSADSILRELGITDPAEIDVEAIAYHCDAIVKYRQLEGCEARIVALDNHAIITVNQSSRPERQRFSVGHELGHWAGGLQAGGFLCTEEMMEPAAEDQIETEARANEFSADLLMPRFLFEPRARLGAITIDAAEMLAREFQTSLRATAIRLAELAGRPALVACYDTRGRRWFRRGPLVPPAFWPVREVQPDSEAHDLLKGEARPGSRSRPTLTPADLWIDRRDAGDYGIIEQSIVVDDGMVLTMLWWKDERQIAEFEE